MGANREVSDLRTAGILLLFVGNWGIVVVLTRTEFFIETFMMISFGFLTKVVVIRTPQFGSSRAVLTQPQGFLMLLSQ